MKYQPGFTDFFMSPVTGRIILPMMPDLLQDYVWIGNRNDRPLPSPIIIDLRLEIVDIRRRLSETRFILQAASQDFDSSQALNELIPGILKHNQGIVSIAAPWIDYVPVDLPYMNIWIGDVDNIPQPYPRIFLDNLPSMLSADPTKLLGAYNLYRGSPNPLTLGIPEIVKTLHITNMADLPEGYLWIGTNSSDPLNFGPNRPVPIIVLPLANMADLPYQKIWRGDITNRPVPVDDLTDLEGRVTITEENITDINDGITTINETLTEINTELGDINVEIGDINLNIESIFDSLLEINTEIGDINIHLGDIDTHLGDIDIHLGDIDTHLGSLDVTVGDLQTQIDTNVASGLDHLADLQLQIDTAIASGNDHLATINTTLTYLQSEIDTINTSITTINSTITSILSDITSIFSSISAINSQITTILSDITSINTAISTINTTLTSLQSQIDTINSTITTIESNIANITDVLIPAIYTYIDTSIENITNNFIAGGVIDMNDNRIINLPCDPVEDNDAISFCFLWHILHDEVTVSWS